MMSASIGVNGFASHCADFSPLGPADPIVRESMLIGRDANNP
jgi:hypothetical protein